MDNVVLIVHLILALCLIGVVLLQRSEGGGLGLGGGGGGLVTARGAATALGKVTWALAVAFIATSLALTIIAARSSGGGSVLDRLGVAAPDAVRQEGDVPDADSLLPPLEDGGPDGGLLPRADE